MNNARNDRFKFRYWDKFNQHMSYSHKAENLHEFFTWYHKATCAGNGTELMQCTGLKDCNGSDIYDGEVVDVCDKFVGQVYFECGVYWISSPEHSDSFDLLDLELHEINDFVRIVGNVWEVKSKINL